MKRTVPAVAAALLMLAGCSDDGGGSESDTATGWAEFEAALDDGAPCGELFEIRNAWDPDSDLVERANEALRDVGCFSSSSERTDL
ncbi:hypothetical protein [Georgenia deserti]|uniref:Lipoprotein n=1 Tax=Georgenia deserti TaxID=2093781 RepID=A0ABW4L3X6_9MICO